MVRGSHPKSLVMMILNIAKATILADSWLLQVEADELNRVPECRIVVCKRKQSKGMPFTRMLFDLVLHYQTYI